jgi:hypothetical protein
VLLGRLDDGLGYYRFAYNGSAKGYVGVIAQAVRAVRPDAVAVARDGSDCLSDPTTSGSRITFGIAHSYFATGRGRPCRRSPKIPAIFDHS